ncbi:MAG: acetyl-CoA carboxylase, carboxyltransferase subunit beta [Nitrospirota bacterium]
MEWFKRNKFLKDSKEKKIRIPEGLWIKCNNCKEIIYRKEIEKNLKVCPKCNYHFPISIDERIALIVDDGSFKELYQGLYPLDPLNFKDSKRYKDRLKENREKTGKRDAIVVGEGSLNGKKIIFGIFNFGFMGGSMGSVVGEKISRASELALAEKIPLIITTASGGARMQEGMLSLMQMAKTSAAISSLKNERVPFISILTDPTFGGVTASFAILGDIIIAEPKSLIGFAGPRVIEQTIKQKLPNGFQRAEFLLEHGIIDMIVNRKEMKETLFKTIDFFQS